MKESYEPSNPLSMPFECFPYDNIRCHFPVEDHWHYFAEILLVRSGKLVVTLNNDTLYKV
ncbi:MAG: AraC family transcriptional regulator, partial [Clostridiales bacterium]|nr:AraC family transcriptional regulator [Clostridiales bacterium]